MSFQDMGSLGEFIAALATVVTLLYLSAQIRQTNLITKAQFGHGLTHRLYERFFQTAKDQEFAEFLGKPAKIINCRKPDDEGLAVIASRNHRSPELEDFIKTLKVASSTSVGSSLKFCLVATGNSDIYPRLGRTMEWDIAAGHAIVKAAGGSVKKMDGCDMTYGKTGLENPNFIVRGLES